MTLDRVQREAEAVALRTGRRTYAIDVGEAGGPMLPVYSARLEDGERPIYIAEAPGKPLRVRGTRSAVTEAPGSATRNRPANHEVKAIQSPVSPVVSTTGRPEAPFGRTAAGRVRATGLGTRSGARNKIVEFLQQNGSASPKEIRESLGLPEKVVSQVLYLYRPTFERVGYGLWRLAA